MLLVQKSILRDAYNDLSIHFLAKVSTHTACSFGTRASFFWCFLFSRFLLIFGIEQPRKCCVQGT